MSYYLHFTDKAAEPEGGENHGQGNPTWEEKSKDFNLAKLVFPSLVLNHSTAVFPPMLSSLHLAAEHRFSNSFVKSSLKGEEEKPHSIHPIQFT